MIPDFHYHLHIN